MKNYLFLMVTGLCLISFGCDYTGVPVEFASACDKANDDKTIEVTGYFNNTGSSMCSSSGNGPMRCPINFVGEPNGEDKIVRAELDLGSGGSSVENIEGKGLTIHDKDGGVIDNKQKVKITANVNSVDYSNPKLQNCWVVVKKIEKAN
ncbi:MAG: hypothetical protein KDB79_15730 [Acidobacteria bacterium]|nr:hypothetical protein [Acidobacteriota bacterium]